MSYHQRDEIRWNKKGYFERFDGKKYWRKLCVVEGCMKRAKVLNWCKRVSLLSPRRTAANRLHVLSALHRTETEIRRPDQFFSNASAANGLDRGEHHVCIASHQYSSSLVQSSIPTTTLSPFASGLADSHADPCLSVHVHINVLVAAVGPVAISVGISRAKRCPTEQAWLPRAVRRSRPLASSLCPGAMLQASEEVVLLQTALHRTDEPPAAAAAVALLQY